MRKFLILACAAAALSTPTFASEPSFGFADRVVMACMHVGVTNVSFDEQGFISRYRHNNTASKNKMELCLTRAYQQTLADQFPNHAPGSADTVRVLPNGHIKLERSSF